MTPDDPRLAIPQYLTGDLPEAERLRLEAELSRDSQLKMEVAELQALWQSLGQVPQAEPSPALRARFYQRLNRVGKPAESQPVRKAQWWWAPWQQMVAAAVLFAAGLYFGGAGRAQHNHDDEVAQMRSQVQSLREMVALSLLDRQSAASRLQGVSWSSRVDRPDNELLSALLSALNSDPNVNVRLSSVDALEKYSQDASIRKALVESISRQDSPLVQIALIDTLTHARDRSAMDEFRRLSEAKNLNPAVRQRAHWAMVRLDAPTNKTPE